MEEVERKKHFKAAYFRQIWEGSLHSWRLKERSRKKGRVTTLARGKEWKTDDLEVDRSKGKEKTEILGGPFSWRKGGEEHETNVRPQTRITLRTPESHKHNLQKREKLQTVLLSKRDMGRIG